MSLFDFLFGKKPEDMDKRDQVYLLNKIVNLIDDFKRILVDNDPYDDPKEITKRIENLNKLLVSMHDFLSLIHSNQSRRKQVEIVRTAIANLEDPLENIHGSRGMRLLKF